MDEKRKKLCRRAIIVSIVICLIGLAVSISASAAKRRKADAIMCGNQMVALTLGGRIYAGDHGDRFPTNFYSMEIELGGAPQILFCPADKSRRVVKDWSAFKQEDCSYELVSPGISVDAKGTVFLRCKFHGFTSYSDGGYFDGQRRRNKEAVNVR